MPTVPIEPKLYKRMEEAATAQASTIDALLNKAVRQYLWELDRQIISQESKVYRQNHAELKTRYLGQYIAMRNGTVIDHDTSFQTLHRRIRAKFGSTPVMITKVEDVAEQTFTRHGFQLEPNHP